MSSAENFLRSHILRGSKTYRKGLIFERSEQPQQQGYHPRVSYKCLLCDTGYMPKKQVQSHCKGGQHQTNYAALQGMVLLPSQQTTTTTTVEEPPSGGIEPVDDDEHRFY